VICHEWGKDTIAITTNASHDGDRNTFEVMTSSDPPGTLRSLEEKLLTTLDHLS